MDYSKSRGQRYRDRAINSNKDGWSIENQNAMDAEKERQKQEEEKRKEQDWIDRGVTNPNHKNTNFWFDRLRHQIKKEVENRFFIYKKTKKVYIETEVKISMKKQNPEARRKRWEGYDGDYRDYPHEKSEYYANEMKDKGKVSVKEFIKAGATGKVHYYHEDSVEKWARIHYKHHEGKMPKDMEHYDITQIVKGKPGVSPDVGDVSEDGGVSADTIQLDVGPDVKKKEGAGRRRRRRKKTRKKRRKSRRGRKSRRKSKKSRRKRRRTRRRRR